MTNIGKGITVTGTIRADEPVAVAGTVNGELIVSDHDLVVEHGGRIDGSATAKRITIRGTFVGKMIALDGVRLDATAWVKSDIAAPAIVMADGATFNGAVEPARVEAALRVAAYRRRGEPSNVA